MVGDGIRLKWLMNGTSGRLLWAR